MGAEEAINRQRTLLAIAEFGKRLQTIDAAAGQMQHLLFKAVPGLPPGGALDHLVFVREAFDVLRSGLLFVARQQGLSPEDLARAYEDDFAAAKAAAQAATEDVPTDQEPAVVAAEAEGESVDFNRLRELAYGQAQPDVVADSANRMAEKHGASLEKLGSEDSESLPPVAPEASR